MNNFFVVCLSLVCERLQCDLATCSRLLVHFQNKLSSLLLKWLIVSTAETFRSPLGCNKTHSFKKKSSVLFSCSEESPHVFIKAARRAPRGVKRQRLLCWACRFKFVPLCLLHFYELLECVALPAADRGPTNKRCCQNVGARRGGSGVRAEWCRAPTFSPPSFPYSSTGGPIICLGSF